MQFGKRQVATATAPASATDTAPASATATGTAERVLVSRPEGFNLSATDIQHFSVGLVASGLPVY